MTAALLKKATNKIRRELDPKNSILLPNEDLKRGIWPRSLPLWLAAFYMALFIIRPWEHIFPWLGDIYFERMYAIFMMAVVFFSGKSHFRVNIQTITVVLFTFGICVSAVLARNTSLAWDSLYVYITLLIFYFILIMVIRSPYDLTFMITCYIVTMTVYLAKAQWEYFVHGQHRYDMGVVRLTGIESTFGGPNNLAMSIVVSLPMLLFLWNSRKEFSAAWPEFYKRWFPRVLIIYALLAVSSIILTNSRSGFVSFALFVALVTFRGRGAGRKVGYIFLAVIFMLVLWQVLPDEKKGRFRTIWAPEEGPENAQISAEGRIEGFKAGVEMFERYPVAGVGIGNFIAYRVPYVDGVPLNAHNLVGQVLGETGIVGAGTFMLMVAVVLINIRATRSLAGRQSNVIILHLSSISLACRDALLLLAFEGIFGHNLTRFNWLWLAAFCVLAVRFAKRDMRQNKLGIGKAK